MPHQRSSDVEYIIGLEGVPREVALLEDSWKVVKDTVRNLIDGQPRQVNLRDSVFWFTVDSREDAEKACGMTTHTPLQQTANHRQPAALAMHTWYDVVGGGNNRPSTIMRASLVEVPRKGQVDYMHNSSPSYRHGRRLSTASHTRTSSASSTSSSVQSPPTAIGYGLLPPGYPMRYPPAPAASGGFVAVHMASSPEAFTFLPTPATMYSCGPSFVHPEGFGSNPAVYPQAPSMRPQLEPQQGIKSPVQREIIIQNLKVEITQSWLKDFLTGSIGPVQRCEIRERGDKKRHALVSFTYAEHARLAASKLDGQLVEGRQVFVRLTKEEEKGPVIVNGAIEE
ncbi:MAG: hypothetical protein Q9182_006201 [Xanthomendoza sp. 2 TL-2023]